MTTIQAIDLMKGLEQSLDDYCELNDEGKTAFRMAITALELFGNSEQLPSAQRWIPCSERLPEEKERSYWVCLETGGQCQCRWTNDMYGLGANKWSKWGWHIMDKPQYSKIVAWMPLPEPYREDIE